MTQTVECSICHKKLSRAEFLSESPIPAEEVCLPCERLTPDKRDVCRVEYVRAHPASGFQCFSCRNSLVPC
jgi:hypothetical protein